MAIGGILGGMMEADKTYAQIDALKLQGEVQRAQLESIKRAQALDDATKAKLQEEAQRQLEARKLSDFAESDMPGSAADLADAGVTRPAGMADLAGPKPEKVKVSEQHLAEAASEEGYAKAALEANNLAVMQRHQQNAHKARQAAATAAEAERKEQEQTWKNIIQYTSSAVDEASLNAAISLAKAQYPGVEKLLDGMGLAKSPTGRYLWDNTANPEIIEALKEASMTELQRIRKVQKEEELRRKEQERIDREEDRKRRDEDRDRDAAIRREGQEFRGDLARDRNERRKQEQAERVTKEVQRNLNKDPVYSNFTRYQQAFDLADQTIKVLQRPNGSELLNASDMRALSTQFSNITEHFRARTGGKYALQDIDKFNGLYDKFDKFVESIGKGTPALSAAAATDVANTIKQLYDIANKNAIIVSLEAMEKVARKGGDPMDITLKGNMRRLQQIGQIKRVKKGDKAYISIGHGDNVVEIEDTSGRDE